MKRCECKPSSIKHEKTTRKRKPHQRACLCPLLTFKRSGKMLNTCVWAKMAEHDPAAFELIFLSETAWCCLHWRQLCVYAWMCVCVRVERVQSCRTHCSLLQSQSSYSVYVFVSAWWRRWVLLRPNESICIQGAFFLSHAGGSKRAATWEPVQRLVGALAVFPKQTRKYKHRLALNSPFFFSSFEEVEKAVQSHTQPSCSVLYQAWLLSAFQWGLRARGKKKAEEGCVQRAGTTVPRARPRGEWQLLMSSPLSDPAP